MTRELLGRREWASLVANRLSKEMISQRSGLPQLSMALSIKHGVSVIHEVGLKSTVHGDKDLLATVIRCTITPLLELIFNCLDALGSLPVNCCMQWKLMKWRHWARETGVTAR